MLDGIPTTYADAIAANRPADARKGVDRLVNAGADFLKVYTRIDPPLLKAILDEARTFNLRVTAHLGLTDAVTAARAGVSSIEHLTGVPEAASRQASSIFAAHYRSFFAGWTAFERSWAGLDSADLARVAGELARNNVILVPTLVLHETFSRLDDPAVLQDSMLKVVPEAEQRTVERPRHDQACGLEEGRLREPSDAPVPARISSSASSSPPAASSPPGPMPRTRC